jgi:hypothetical protein
VDGLTDQQAGDHPYETTVSFSLNTRDTIREVDAFEVSEGLTKDVIVDVPPGFVGNPTVVPQCPEYDVSANNCPPDTEIGFARIQIFGRSSNSEQNPYVYPLYNVIPAKGYPAEFVIQVTTLSCDGAVVCERQCGNGLWCAGHHAGYSAGGSADGCRGDVLWDACNRWELV